MIIIIRAVKKASEMRIAVILYVHVDYMYEAQPADTLHVHISQENKIMMKSAVPYSVHVHTQ